MSPVHAGGRRRAREAALQMLYQCEVGRVGPDEAVRSYWPAHDPEGAVGEELRAFSNGLVRSTIERMPDIDRLLVARTVNWRLERLTVIDRLILRLAVCELLTTPETSARVVINEALEIARTFTGEEAVAFINGVLDAVRKDMGRTAPDA